jgi:hypothetical protein
MTRMVLDLVEGGNVNRLDEVLEGSDVLLKKISANLVVLDDAAISSR